MNLKKLRLSLVIASISLLVSSCITIPDIEVCMVPFKLENGAICESSNSDHSRQLSPFDLITLIEGSEEIPPAFIISSQDFEKLKTALQQACHKLGDSCSKEIRSFNARFH